MNGPSGGASQSTRGCTPREPWRASQPRCDSVTRRRSRSCLLSAPDSTTCSVLYAAPTPFEPRGKTDLAGRHRPPPEIRRDERVANLRTDTVTDSLRAGPAAASLAPWPWIVRSPVALPCGRAGSFAPRRCSLADTPARCIQRSDWVSPNSYRRLAPGPDPRPSRALPRRLGYDPARQLRVTREAVEEAGQRPREVVGVASDQLPHRSALLQSQLR